MLSLVSNREILIYIAYLITVTVAGGEAIIYCLRGRK
jgi:hypothetical protein